MTRWQGHPVPAGRSRGDGLTHQSVPDPREAGGGLSGNQKASGPIDCHEGIRVPTRSFR